MDEERRRIRIQRIMAIILYLIMVGILFVVYSPLPWYRIFPIIIITGIFTKLTIWPQPMTGEERAYQRELKIDQGIIHSRPVLRYGLYALIGLMVLLLASVFYEPWFKLLFPISFILIMIGSLAFFATLSRLHSQKNVRESQRVDNIREIR